MINVRHVNYDLGAKAWKNLTTTKDSHTDFVFVAVNLIVDIVAICVSVVPIVNVTNASKKTKLKNISK